MSPSAILALLGLNLWLLCVGIAIVFAFRSWGGARELVRWLGVAYMAGVAAMGIVWTLQLTVGIRFSLLTIFGSGALVAAAGVLVGLRRHGDRRGHRALRSASVSSALIAGIGAAAGVVYLEAQFRAARLAGLYDFDAWSFWVPKAKAIYYFGGLDERFFRDLPGPSYPPLVPALEAAAFRFMGTPDEVTLHVQFALLLAGFAAALVGLLWGRAHQLLIWFSLLLVLVTPHVVDDALRPEGDFLLDELFALAAVLLALWLRNREEGFLPLATLLLAAAVLTKREGIVLAACAVVAGLAVTWREPRAALRLALAGAVVAAAIVPWRILLAVRGLPGGGPEAGGFGLISNIDRAWPSLRLALSTLFDFHIWLIAVPVLLVATVAAALVGDRRLAAYAGVLGLLCLAAFTWSSWAFPSLPITKVGALNPIARFTGALVLAGAGLVPLLLSHGPETTWRRR
jgi:hypothetical protein